MYYTVQVEDKNFTTHSIYMGPGGFVSYTVLFCTVPGEVVVVLYYTVQVDDKYCTTHSIYMGPEGFVSYTVLYCTWGAGSCLSISRVR